MTPIDHRLGNALWRLLLAQANTKAERRAVNALRRADKDDPRPFDPIDRALVPAQLLIDGLLHGRWPWSQDPSDRKESL